MAGYWSHRGPMKEPAKDALRNRIAELENVVLVERAMRRSEQDRLERVQQELKRLASD
jgi:hypothetical protein